MGNWDGNQLHEQSGREDEAPDPEAGGHHGAGAKGEVGKGPNGVTAGSSDSQTSGLSSCEAHHVSGSPQEDCGVSTGTLGENKNSTKEGCIVGDAQSSDEFRLVFAIVRSLEGLGL